MEITEPKIFFVEGYPVVFYRQIINDFSWVYWSELEAGYKLPTGKTAYRKPIQKARSKRGKQELIIADSEYDAIVQITVEMLERHLI